VLGIERQKGLVGVGCRSGGGGRVGNLNPCCVTLSPLFIPFMTSVIA
jgi:hypothetical protein